MRSERLRSAAEVQMASRMEETVTQKVKPCDWKCPSDDSLDEFCRSLSEETRMRLYRHLHALGCRL